MGIDASADASPNAVQTCNLEAPFKTPVPIAELNTSDDEGTPRLTHDELTIYFSRAKPFQDEDLFVATRSSPTGKFGAATSLALNTSQVESYGSPTGDDLTLYFSSDRNGITPNLFVATRATTNSDFGNVINLQSLNDDVRASDGPYVLPDGKTLYYATEISAIGGDFTDLARAAGSGSSFTVDTSGVFANVNTFNVEAEPVVTPDELTLYFVSDRDADWHVYRSTRATRSEPFDYGEPVYELDSNFTSPGWVSDDGCRLYITTELPDGSTDLYVATRPAK